MSGGSPEVGRLLEVIADLRREIHQLKTEVVQLEGRVVELESARLVGGAADSEYELVVGDSRGASAASAPGYLPVASTPPPTASPDLALDRIRAAQDIGFFLRRCLQGEPRGKSGRDRIAAPSSVYIVCKCFVGETFDPPRVFFSWASAKSLVIKGGTPGPSIFVGVPTINEARIAVEAAGCELPASLR